MKTGSHFLRIFVYTMAVFGASTMAPWNFLRAADTDYKIEGTYAVHSKIGGVGTGIGVYKVSRNGTFTGYALLNIPSMSGGRILVKIPISNGTVTYNADGITGTASYDGTPEGTTTPIHVDEDFVITKTEKHDETKIATEIFDQRRQPSALLGSSYEVTVVWNRLPNEVSDGE